MEIKTRFDSIVEQRIQDAIREGKFRDLPGHGKPLELEDDSNIPEELRLSFKVLKNAGMVPEELELNAEVRRLEDMIEGLTDVNSKLRAMKKLDFLKKKILRTKGPTAVFSIPEDYELQVVEKVEKPETVRKK